MIATLYTIRKKTVALILCCITLCISSTKATAQDLIQTMTEQLAKLEVYLQETKQGYTIVKKGLNLIGDIKNGDFTLHSVFFGSLQTVNPAIKNWVKVKDIVAMQAAILIGCTNAVKQFTASRTFSQDGIIYLKTVYSNLKDLTAKDINELAGLITDGQWQMTDDERMHRIDQLYASVRDKYSFQKSFTAGVAAQSQMRTQDEANFQHFGKLTQP